MFSITGVFYPISLWRVPSRCSLACSIPSHSGVLHPLALWLTPSLHILAQFIPLFSATLLSFSISFLFFAKMLLPSFFYLKFLYPIFINHSVLPPPPIVSDSGIQISHSLPFYSNLFYLTCIICSLTEAVTKLILLSYICQETLSMHQT